MGLLVACVLGSFAISVWVLFCSCFGVLCFILWSMIINNLRFKVY